MLHVPWSRLSDVSGCGAGPWSITRNMTRPPHTIEKSIYMAKLKQVGDELMVASMMDPRRSIMKRIHIALSQTPRIRLLVLLEAFGFANLSCNCLLE